VAAMIRLSSGLTAIEVSSRGSGSVGSLTLASLGVAAGIGRDRLTAQTGMSWNIAGAKRAAAILSTRRGGCVRLSIMKRGGSFFHGERRTARLATLATDEQGVIKDWDLLKRRTRSPQRRRERRDSAEISASLSANSAPLR
jgi:hypothetical protein